MTHTLNVLPDLFSWWWISALRANILCLSPWSDTIDVRSPHVTWHLTFHGYLTYYGVSSYILWRIILHIMVYHLTYYGVSSYILWRIILHIMACHLIYYGVSSCILWRIILHKWRIILHIMAYHLSTPLIFGPSNFRPLWFSAPLFFGHPPRIRPLFIFGHLFC